MPIDIDTFDRNGMLVDKKVKQDTKLDDLIHNFSLYIGKFDSNNPFSGPSEYFYINKIIPATQGDYSAVFTKDNIQWIYATLASWGMHRMGPKGAKINDFASFEQCIMQNKTKILTLKGLKLYKIEIADHIDDINELYYSFWSLMKSNSKLVATTKVMHFLLPHLIPPMDREYTMNFFGKNLPVIKSANDKTNIEKENRIFQSVLTDFWIISKKVECTQFINKEFSPTVPKVIDNAIVSYVRENG